MLIVLGSWLSKKSNYGEHPERFSNAEKTIYIVYQLEVEVNNGGFDQFLFNSGGNFANETAAICDRAFSVFDQPIPADRQKRITLLNDIRTDIWVQCDTEFYAYPDNLTELCYDFVMAHRDEFTR